VPRDDRDPTAERFFPQGDFPQVHPPDFPDEGPMIEGRSGSRRSAAASEGAEVGPTLPEGASGPERAAQGDPDASSGAGRGGRRAGAAGEGAAPEGAAAGSDAASGPELARAVLDAALAKRRAAASNPRRRATGTGEGRRLRGYSGPGPDPRDPQPFGAMLEKLMKARGWEKPKAEATVFGAWEKVVGADIAKHSRPIKLDDGVLTVEAESTAWATQLRLLAAKLLKSIAAEVGHNVVTKLNIHGPAAPSWSKGPRRVQGRGPRDTYG
jgi:predicted nucleic acid-binding Zn ribbon protein